MADGQNVKFVGLEYGVDLCHFIGSGILFDKGRAYRFSSSLKSEMTQEGWNIVLLAREFSEYQTLKYLFFCRFGTGRGSFITLNIIININLARC